MKAVQESDPLKVWLCGLAARLVALGALEYLAVISSLAAWVALAAVLVMQYLVLTTPALQGEKADGTWARGRRRRR